MAQIKINISSIDVPANRLERVKTEYSFFIERITRLGAVINPCCEEVSREAKEEQWVKDARPSPEAIKLEESIKEINEDVKNLICPDCGFVAKHGGALGGHIRFKHKR